MGGGGRRARGSEMECVFMCVCVCLRTYIDELALLGCRSRTEYAWSEHGLECFFGGGLFRSLCLSVSTSRPVPLMKDLIRDVCDAMAP